VTVENALERLAETDPLFIRLGDIHTPRRKVAPPKDGLAPLTVPDSQEEKCSASCVL
jgi:hypothetical protein